VPTAEDRMACANVDRARAEHRGAVRRIRRRFSRTASHARPNVFALQSARHRTAVGTTTAASSTQRPPAAHNDRQRNPIVLQQAAGARRHADTWPQAVLSSQRLESNALHHTLARRTPPRRSPNPHFTRRLHEHRIEPPSCRTRLRTSGARPSIRRSHQYTAGQAQDLSINEVSHRFFTSHHSKELV
jgi:hypothetical protein